MAGKRLISRYEAAFVVLILAVVVSFAYADDVPSSGQAIASGEMSLLSQMSWAGAPWSLFDSNTIIDLNRNDALTKVQEPVWLDAVTKKAEFDIFARGDYIYSTGYVYLSGESRWQPITFAADTERGGGSQYLSGGWISGAAISEGNSLSLMPGTNFFVAYTCQWINGQWKCGCRTENDCGKWQVQTFEVSDSTGNEGAEYVWNEVSTLPLRSSSQTGVVRQDGISHHSSVVYDG